MVEVTPEDREAAAAVLGGAAPDGLIEGRKDDLSIVQAFARHRIAAYQRGKLEGARLALEATAKTARDYAAKAKGRGWMPHADSAPKAAQHIAANIRALDPAKIVGEG